MKCGAIRSIIGFKMPIPPCGDKTEKRPGIRAVSAAFTASPPGSSANTETADTISRGVLLLFITAVQIAERLRTVSSILNDLSDV